MEGTQPELRQLNDMRRAKEFLLDELVSGPESFTDRNVDPISVAEEINRNSGHLPPCVRAEIYTDIMAGNKDYNDEQH